MTFPLIDRIYEYKNEKVVLWQQDLFCSVFLRTIPESGGSIYSKANWWKFMISAKKLGKFENTSKYY